MKRSSLFLSFMKQYPPYKKVVIIPILYEALPFQWKVVIILILYEAVPFQWKDRHYFILYKAVPFQCKKKSSQLVEPHFKGRVIAGGVLPPVV
jgi:hypothetical protein